jgi:hypothetical protein
MSGLDHSRRVESVRQPLPLYPTPDISPRHSEPPRWADAVEEGNFSK